MKARTVRALFTLVAGALVGTTHAAPADDAPVLQRNGALSRHVWNPSFARGDWGGTRVSAGLALGLRGPVRDNLGTAVAPALTLHLEDRARVSLLARGDRGVMVVWHRSN